MSLQDEDWENLSKKLGIQDDEMSLAQFIQLHLLEAKNGESVELWMALWTMGYNHTLKPDESFNFKVKFNFIKWIFLQSKSYFKICLFPNILF